MNCCYAIFPDDRDDETQPTAVFEHIEDAMDYASSRYATGNCRIKYIALAAVQPGDRQASTRLC
jgi:hypothetical protein